MKYTHRLHLTDKGLLAIVDALCFTSRQYRRFVDDNPSLVAAVYIQDQVIEIERVIQTINRGTAIAKGRKKNREARPVS